MNSSHHYTALGLLTGLLYCGTLTQAAENNPSSPPQIPLEVRIKQAHKPCSWVQIDFMSVAKGKDEAYLAIERDWKKIHEELARRGKMIDWSLWKAEDPEKAGFNYATLKHFDCVSDALNVYDWDEIAQFYGKDQLNALFERTGPARTLTRSELWETADFTLSKSEKGNRKRAMVGLMKSKERAKYEAMEKDIFCKVWQCFSDKQPSHGGWMFNRLFSFTGQQPAYDYFTVHLINTDMPKLSDEELGKAYEQAWKDAGLSADKVKAEDLRTQVNTFFVERILETSPESNPLRNEWQKLTGTWKATNADGSWRIKRIVPFWEEVETYGTDGNLEFKARLPMRIELRDGMRHFYSLHDEGVWHSIYAIHDGLWYEQWRGMFMDSTHKPNNFFIYSKVNQ